MPFPQSERVIYKKNPLNKVICQLRFPTILKINGDDKALAQFQDKIRKIFPLYNRETPKISLPNEIVGQLPPDILSIFSGNQGIQSHQFKSEDQIWTISLTADFIALETTKYEKWEQFREYIDVASKAFTEIYEPNYYTRIGLRYENVISRSKLELQNKEWRDLLKDFVIGELASEDLYSEINEYSSTTIIQLERENTAVRMRKGLARAKDNNEIMYLLDNDFYVLGRIGIEDANNFLNEFNGLNRRLFRWCIEDTLHRALEPEPI